MAIVKAFAKTMASGATLTGMFDLSNHGTVANYLVVPTMNSNSQLHIQASEDGTTFRRIYHPSINSSTVGANLFAIPSSVTNSIIPIPNGFQYLKIEATATVDNGALFKIICAD